jgi:hypothetical protein
MNLHEAKRKGGQHGYQLRKALQPTCHAAVAEQPVRAVGGTCPLSLTTGIRDRLEGLLTAVVVAADEVRGSSAQGESSPRAADQKSLLNYF